MLILDYALENLEKKFMFMPICFWNLLCVNTVCSWCSSTPKNTKIPRINEKYRLPNKIPKNMPFYRVKHILLQKYDRSRYSSLVLGNSTRIGVFSALTEHNSRRWPNKVLAKVTEQVLAIHCSILGLDTGYNLGFHYSVFGFDRTHRSLWPSLTEHNSVFGFDRTHKSLWLLLTEQIILGFDRTHKSIWLSLNEQKCSRFLTCVDRTPVLAHIVFGFWVLGFVRF